jgi:hypothetical protein
MLVLRRRFQNRFYTLVTIVSMPFADFQILQSEHRGLYIISNSHVA